MMRGGLAALLLFVACSGALETRPAPAGTDAAEEATSAAPREHTAPRNAANGATTKPESAPRSASAPPPVSARASAKDASERSALEPVVQELDVQGFAPAVVVVPDERSKTPLPVLIAAHGAGGSPDVHCRFWRELTRKAALIACPRGAPFSRQYANAYYYPDHRALGREVDALVDALAARFGGRADTSRMVYAGYSQGATMGALMLVERAARFPQLVLIEGGFSEWNVAIGRRFAERGGQRVVFVCGTRGCARHAERSAAWLAQAGIASRALHAEGGGHTFLGAVAPRVIAGFAWLIGEQAAWQGRFHAAAAEQ